MNLLMIPRLALKALRQNVLRTGLTMLGIIIGVGAVICVVAIGEGAQASVERAITNIGANMIWVEAGGVNRGGVRTGAGGTKTLTLGDYEAIKEHVPLVTNVTPQADTRVQVVYGNQNWSTPVRGVGPEYLALKNWKVVKGGMYTDVDVERANIVCVLGQTLVDQLFAGQDPIGETMRVNNEPCLIVGVLDVKGQSATGQDQDDQFLMPYSTVMKKIKGQIWLDDIMCSAISAQVVDQAEQDIAVLMRERHHIRPGADDDFNLRHPTEIAEAVKQSTQTMEGLLAAVASVSLIVGGIGIMNIMLVSVTERTREIGLRQAVGARARDVLRQFLVEAVILSLIGGAIGVGLGTFGARIIADSFQWPTRVSANAIALAFGCSAAIGVFFGYYPARQAASLDPIVHSDSSKAATINGASHEDGRRRYARCGKGADMRPIVTALVLTVASLQAASGQTPLTLVGTIGLPGVEGRIDHLTADTAAQRLYVAALGNNTVEMLDLKNNKHFKSMPGFREPQGVVFMADAKLVAVANGQGEGVQFIDANDGHPTRAVKLGEDSDNVRYDPVAKRLFVGFGGGALAAVSPADGTVLGTAKLAGHPESFQLEHTGSRVFVNVPDANQIAVIDRVAMKVIATWPVAGAKANFPMALDEANHRVFVGCRRPAKVLVFDTTTGRESASFDIVGDTDDLFYDAARKRVYVSGGEGFIDVFQDEAGRFNRMAHVPTAAGARTSLFVADQSRFYLAVPHRGSQKAEIRVYDVR